MKYIQLLDKMRSEQAILFTKKLFESLLSNKLNLTRVTAPLFLQKGTGLNDDLNGFEKKVSFCVKALDQAELEVVNSLAKWKRQALKNHNILVNHGIYTDMNAIRPDEDLDEIHSLYVDQWDWEVVIDRNSRNLDYLKQVVGQIYEALRQTEQEVLSKYPELNVVPPLPNDITFVTSEQLLQKYPNLTERDRENEYVREHGAVFIIGIGARLSNGQRHDGRAPDYDDWSTPNELGTNGLNGDIVVWNHILDRSFEISSMGIRVDRHALVFQLNESNSLDRLKLDYHSQILNGELPLSIGGGIGQSRVSMFMLRKHHIGQVQVSAWPTQTLKLYRESGMELLE